MVYYTKIIYIGNDIFKIKVTNFTKWQMATYNFSKLHICLQISDQCDKRQYKKVTFRVDSCQNDKA